MSALLDRFESWLQAHPVGVRRVLVAWWGLTVVLTFAAVIIAASKRMAIVAAGAAFLCPLAGYRLGVETGR